MKQACKKIAACLVATAFMVPVTLIAQEDQKVKEEKHKEEKLKDKKEVEQIVITRTGDKKEKIVVEIVGDKITVNGKPVDEMSDGDVSVRRNNIKDVWAFADGLRGGGNFYNPGQTFNFIGGDSNRAVLGVTTEKSETGVEIQEISKESAAAKAGLKTGDIITRINDKKIETPDDLSKAIRAKKPGEKVTVAYMRDKKENQTTAELGKWKGTGVFKTIPGQGFDMNMENLHLDEIMPRVQTPRAPLTSQGYYSLARGPKLGLSVQDTDDGKGVKILEVDEDSYAAKAGLKEEDIITEIDGKAVNSVDQVSKIVRDSKEKPSVMMKLQRGGKTQNIEVKIPRKLKSADL